MGWVSILDLYRDHLCSLLRIPAGVVPVAYLCVGYVAEFPDRPELEIRGWEHREQLEKLIHFDQWGLHDERRAAALLRAASIEP